MVGDFYLRWGNTLIWMMLIIKLRTHFLEKHPSNAAFFFFMSKIGPCLLDETSSFHLLVLFVEVGGASLSGVGLKPLHAISFSVLSLLEIKTRTNAINFMSVLKKNTSQEKWKNIFRMCGIKCDHAKGFPKLPCIYHNNDISRHFQRRWARNTDRRYRKRVTQRPPSAAWRAFGGRRLSRIQPHINRKLSLWQRTTWNRWGTENTGWKGQTTYRFPEINEKGKISQWKRALNSSNTGKWK